VADLVWIVRADVSRGAMAIGTPPDQSRSYMPPSSSNEAVGIAQLKPAAAAAAGAGAELEEGALREVRVVTSDPIVWCVEHSRSRSGGS
jgi:hypothetical protein